MYFPTGIKDVDREILSKLPDKDILKICSLNKYLHEKVCDKGFFRRLLKINYSELEIDKNYKQEYIKTVYYISKMKGIEYKYVPNGEVAKDQYVKAEFVYNQIQSLQNSRASSWSYIVMLRNIINNGNLDLIKYALRLHTYTKEERRGVLNSISIYKSTLHIIKYFVETEIASSIAILLALEVARHNKNTEMINYFTNKI